MATRKAASKKGSKGSQKVKLPSPGGEKILNPRKTTKLVGRGKGKS